MRHIKFQTVDQGLANSCMSQIQLPAPSETVLLIFPAPSEAPTSEAPLLVFAYGHMNK
jgi:hypothetical protein